MSFISDRTADLSLSTSAPVEAIGASAALTNPLLQASWQGGSRASAIAFIDANVTDYQALTAGIVPGTEVHILDSSQDAVTQITNTLLGRHDISGLHIVSHGEAGGLDFGNGKLNLSDLPQYAAQLQSWSNALTNDADILLYGCNVAQGELGKAFTSILSQLTGADVAASDNLTGKGGDWILEFNTGKIESDLAFQASTLASYQSSLISVTATNNPTTLLAAIAGDTTGLSNITTTVTGDAQAFGTFTSDPFGFGSGLVISTGAVTNVVGPNNATDEGTDLGTAGDVADSFDLARLDISFNADSVTRSLFFQFVFGSEEFPEFGGSNKNDSFDLLLNGVNLAKLSDGKSVTINNLAASSTGPFGVDYIANATNNPNTQLDAYTRALTFQGALNPNALNTISIRIRDVGDGIYDSAAFIKFNTFGTAPLSSPPVLTLSGSSASYSTGGAPILLEPSATVIDSDSPNLDTGILAVQISSNATATDQLAIKNEGTGAGQIGVSGSNVTYNFGSGAVTIGTFSGGTSGTTPLVITFNSSSSPTAAQALLRNITFSNSSGSPSTNPRTISFNMTDGDGGTSLASTKTVNFTTGNFAPTISTNALSLSEGGSVVLSSSNINATDPDNTAAQLTYTASTISGGQFELVANAGVAITSFTQADINSGAVQFVHGGGEMAPSYSLTVNDGALSSGSSTVAIGTFTNVNDAALIGGILTGSVTEDATTPNLTTTGILTVVDPDTGESNFITQSNKVGTYGSFTLNSTGNWSYSAVNSQTAIQQLNAGQTLTDSFDVKSIDGTTKTVTITINGTNDVADTNLYWRNDISGDNVIWYLKGKNFIGNPTSNANYGARVGIDYDFLTPIADRNWKMVGQADFNGDNKTDIVWRNTASGDNLVWYMNGKNFVGSGTNVFADAVQGRDYDFLLKVADTNWNIEGAGDFDGNTQSDLIWRNKVTGDNLIWNFKGRNFISGSAPLVADLDYKFIFKLADQNWKIEAVGDFDGDKKADIVWRNYASGLNTIWYANSTKLFSPSPTQAGLVEGVDYDFLPPLADSNWHIESTADINDDGKTDLIWRNYQTGQNTVFYLDGKKFLVNSNTPIVQGQDWDNLPILQATSWRIGDVEVV